MAKKVELKVSKIGMDFFAKALLLLFITLKLTGHITWSWWFVLAPFWVVVLVVFFAIVTLLVLGGGE